MTPLIAVGAAAVLTLASSADARGPCAPFKEADRNLQEVHGERQVFAGVTSAGSLLLIYLNPKNGSWTAIAVRPQGALACALGAGADGHTTEAGPSERS